MNDNNETNAALLKILVAWIGTAVGGMSLSSLVLGTTLIFTMLQIFVILRKIWRNET